MSSKLGEKNAKLPSMFGLPEWKELMSSDFE
jgi:hypothetical protein